MLIASQLVCSGQEHWRTPAVKAPLVSVIVPAYNAERYVRDCIESIIRQTYRNFEIIAIDDGSTDGTLSALQAIQDNRLRVVALAKNTGLTNVRNRGVAESRGELIAWLDSDDISHPRRLQLQVEALQDPAVDICGSYVQAFGSATDRWQYPCSAAQIRCRMLFDDPLATSSVTMRRSLLVGMDPVFRDDFPPAEDYDLWERIATATNTIILPRYLTHYRVHGAQSSTRGREKQRSAVWAIQNRQLERLNILPSDEEKALHLKIGVDWNLSLTNEELDQCHRWLEKLASANDSNSVYPEAAFRYTLADRYFSILRRSLGRPDLAMNRFRTLSLHKSRPLTLKDRARLFVDFSRHIAKRIDRTVSADPRRSSTK